MNWIADCGSIAVVKPTLNWYKDLEEAMHDAARDGKALFIVSGTPEDGAYGEEDY